MMLFSRVIKVIWIILSCVILFSCAVKPVKPVLSSEALLEKIKLENPYRCRIKKKGIFSLENRFNKTKFKGYIVKECDNSFKMNILGLFNQVAYRVKFKDGQLDIFEADKNINDEVSVILTAEEVTKMSGLLNIPLITPGPAFKLTKTQNGQYQYQHENADVIVDPESYKIIKISNNEMTLNYGYQNGHLKTIRYLDFSHNIHITFL